MSRGLRLGGCVVVVIVVVAFFCVLLLEGQAPFRSRRDGFRRGWRFGCSAGTPPNAAILIHFGQEALFG